MEPISVTDAELSCMVEAARQAGQAAMRYFRLGQTVSKAADVREKSHDNPLTKADLEANRILYDLLLAGRSDWGWLSEETVDDANRLQRERVWVVDPIDGTKEFIAGLPQFAVSIGLVIAGQPAAACVYNPAADELYTARRGTGTRLNGKIVQTSRRDQLSGASCLASRSETQRGEWAPFETEFRLTTMGSIAYKLALVAAGRYDITFTLTPKNEWDYCAGLLLVEEAGGKVTSLQGEPCRFNQVNTRTPSLLASNGPLQIPLLERLRGISLGPDRH
ncbi:MAG: 3'(2'),5'-bisphosphate nucleotidase CysQ [Magnetococcus sp. DMHC-1]|nr:3'(2'),5'-bisphosphate nucleotidase CysQ [Magnetococcales bacterium]